MRVVVATLFLIPVALVAAKGQEPSMPGVAMDLLLPGGEERVRLHVVSEVVKAWSSFLDRWFDYFDRDANASLSRVEARRIFSLPSQSGLVHLDLDRCDGDKDGKITKEELKEFYRQTGFSPVQAVVQPSSLQDLLVEEALFRHLGFDVAGQIGEEMIGHAGSLLRKLDENEDELLTPAEVLSLGVAPKPPKVQSSGFRFLPQKDKLAFPIGLSLDDKDAFNVKVGDKLALLPFAAQRVRCPNSVLAFSQDSNSAAKAVGNANQFALALFNNHAGAQKSIEKRRLADDPSLHILAGILPHADRNEDGKLTHAELVDFLALMERGATCPCVIVVKDCSRNLFRHLDVNDDERLDSKELKAAAQNLKATTGRKTWNRNDIPHFARVTVRRGHFGDSFGPVPLVTPIPGHVATKPAAPAIAPNWFRAMDANSDGLLSRAEFLGPIELFRRLDRNEDGLISPEETGF